ncbi:unnamed protein product, partial [Arabidopsis halleri]
LDQVGVEYYESVVIRVTGCPNGCVRPYMAELGLFGDGPNSYQDTVLSRFSRLRESVRAIVLSLETKEAKQRTIWRIHNPHGFEKLIDTYKGVSQ